MDITPEFISDLRYENCDAELIKRLLHIVDNEPNDLLRVCARVWLADNAVKILKGIYDGNETNQNVSERRAVY